ncbi:MAG: hypothetical protein AAF226_12655 [Verrucomicrobiota bacterium]
MRNYADEAQSRTWQLKVGGQATEPKRIDLKPGESRRLQGPFPPEATAVTLELEADAFDQDDSLPMVLPLPREILLSAVGKPVLDPVFKRIIDSLENVRQPDSGEIPDIVLTGYNPLDPKPLPQTGIVLLSQEQPARRFFEGTMVAANHPLMEGLNWQGLICRASPGVPVGENDTALLYQGDRALIVLRDSGEENQLVFNFDIPSSNASSLPSFIVLVHRFTENVRAQKIGESAENTELNQIISVPMDRSSEAASVTIASTLDTTAEVIDPSMIIRAPSEPSFFQLSQGEQGLLKSAAHFADTREANFSEAKTVTAITSTQGDAVSEHTEKDDFWQIWLVLLLIAVVLSWYFLNRKKKVPATA